MIPSCLSLYLRGLFLKRSLLHDSHFFKLRDQTPQAGHSPSLSTRCGGISGDFGLGGGSAGAENQEFNIFVNI